MRPQQLALPSRQTFLHHSCRRITPQSRFRVAHLSTTVVLGWKRRGAYVVLNALRRARNFPAEQRFEETVHRVENLDLALGFIHRFAQLSAMRHAVGEPRRELLHLA